MTGADRRSHLQGLLTNDIEALTPGTGCYSAMLTAQGRMLTDMRVLELGDAILLDVPAAVTSSVRDHLDRFVFAEEVQVEDVTLTRAEVGVYGPGALHALVNACTEGAAPTALFETTRVRVADADAILVRSDEAGVAGYDVIVDADRADSVTAALVAAAPSPSARPMPSGAGSKAAARASAMTWTPTDRSKPAWRRARSRATAAMSGRK